MNGMYWVIKTPTVEDMCNMVDWCFEHGLRVLVSYGTAELSFLLLEDVPHTLLDTLTAQQSVAAVYRKPQPVPAVIAL